ncbi:MAG: acylphosphatase [Candidatus Micrarchaeota archaeon]|nr:acylphosphatase [Candidatus Micrarchaeota archaeon]
MKVTLVVHGVVQGVGYRNLVRGAAMKHKVRGFVRNVRDGSVEIVAVGEEDSLRTFEEEIKVSDRYGPQVMHVERVDQGPGSDSEYEDFRIEHDKKI